MVAQVCRDFLTRQLQSGSSFRDAAAFGLTALVLDKVAQNIFQASLSGNQQGLLAGLFSGAIVWYCAPYHGVVFTVLSVVYGVMLIVSKFSKECLDSLDSSSKEAWYSISSSLKRLGYRDLLNIDQFASQQQKALGSEKELGAEQMLPPLFSALRERGFPAADLIPIAQELERTLEIPFPYQVNNPQKPKYLSELKRSEGTGWDIVLSQPHPRKAQIAQIRSVLGTKDFPHAFVTSFSYEEIREVALELSRDNQRFYEWDLELSAVQKEVKEWDQFLDFIWDNPKSILLMKNLSRVNASSIMIINSIVQCLPAETHLIAWISREKALSVNYNFSDLFTKVELYPLSQKSILQLLKSAYAEIDEKLLNYSLGLVFKIGRRNGGEYAIAKSLIERTLRGYGPITKDNLEAALKGMFPDLLRVKTSFFS